VDIVRRNMRQRFGVQFPIFDKVDVNGEGTHPLYRALKSYEPEVKGSKPSICSVSNSVCIIISFLGIALRLLGTSKNVRPSCSLVCTCNTCLWFQFYSIQM
jgi:hypothetical protein